MNVNGHGVLKGQEIFSRRESQWLAKWGTQSICKGLYMHCVACKIAGLSDPCYLHALKSLINCSDMCQSMLDLMS